MMSIDAWLSLLTLNKSRLTCFFTAEAKEVGKSPSSNPDFPTEIKTLLSWLAIDSKGVLVNIENLINSFSLGGRKTRKISGGQTMAECYY